MELLVSGTVIIDTGPFVPNDMTGDLHNERGAFSKHVLDAGGAWRVAEIADADMPVDFALGKYQLSSSDVFILQAEQPLVDLAALQENKWSEIKAERERRVLDGGFQADGHWFNSDLVSRSQQLALARRADQAQAAGVDMTVQMTVGGQPIYWKTMEDGFVPMTPNLAHAIVAAAEIQDAMHFAAANTHKTTMMALADPTNYDFSGGWPAIYQGA